MHKERSVRLPRIMGPVERWMGKCVPIDAHSRLDPSYLSDHHQNILESIRNFYREYILEQHLVDNRSEPVLILICEYPNFEGYESTAFNLYMLEQKREENGMDAVEHYFRIPDPAHWEAGVELQLEQDKNTSK